MAKYKEYKPAEHTWSDEVKNAQKTADQWNNQQLVDFTFGDKDLGKDYWDTKNALNNLVKPTWAGYSKQGDWDNIYNQLSNMKDFTYDVNGDALYQQYKDQYVNMGNMAMMDTMGQAAAMTGGYGNSYAQSVGQQTYQGYMQQLTDKIPELYSLALSKYNSDRDNLYNMNNLHQQQFANEYGMYRDDVSDYNTDRSYLSGLESTLYDRDYGKKLDETNSRNSNITANRDYYQGVYETLKKSDWDQYIDNETLKKYAIEIANDNLYKNEKYNLSVSNSTIQSNNPVEEDDDDDPVAFSGKSYADAVDYLNMYAKDTVNGLRSQKDFLQEKKLSGGSVTIGGKKYTNYADYVKAYCEWAVS